MGDGSRLEHGRAMSLGGSTPPPSASAPRGSAGGRAPAFQAGDGGSIPAPRSSRRALGRAVEAPAPHAGQAGPTPTGHSRGSANGRPPGLEPDGGGSNPP